MLVLVIAGSAFLLGHGNEASVDDYCSIPMTKHHRHRDGPTAPLHRDKLFACAEVLASILPVMHTFHKCCLCCLFPSCPPVVNRPSPSPFCERWSFFVFSHSFRLTQALHVVSCGVKSLCRYCR